MKLLSRVSKRSSGLRHKRSCFESQCPIGWSLQPLLQAAYLKLREYQVLAGPHAREQNPQALADAFCYAYMYLGYGQEIAFFLGLAQDDPALYAQEH